jgi:2-methylfumaryl-CoA hydratase
MAESAAPPRPPERIVIGGPYFEDLTVGQRFDDAPGVTLTPGHATLHQGLFGDRLRLVLDHELSAAVTGRAEPLAHPLLVCNVAIGQTTTASQRVLGNLFYRRLVLLRQVHIGDTLRTQTEVVGLKQNRSRPGRPASGLVALRVHTSDQHGEAVLDFWRCPMIPLRDARAETGHADDLDAFPAEVSMDQLTAAVPPTWDLDAFAQRAGGGRVEAAAGVTYVVEGRDTVTCAPELARATLNLARTHTDAQASVHGRRLVYGGHTIALAGAQVTRVFPNLVTILAWRSCDHTGAVFEEDILRTEVTVESIHEVARGRLVDLRARTFAAAGDVAADEEREVLDWRFVGLQP